MLVGPKELKPGGYHAGKVKDRPNPVQKFADSWNMVPETEGFGKEAGEEEGSHSEGNFISFQHYCARQSNLSFIKKRSNRRHDIHALKWLEAGGGVACRNLKKQLLRRITPFSPQAAAGCSL